MKHWIFRLSLLLCLSLSTHIAFAQEEEDEETDLNDGGLDADNWRMQYFGLGVTFGKPVTVGLRLQGQIDRIGFGVEGSRTQLNASRKREFQPYIVRGFGLYRFTREYESLFKVYAMAGFTTYINSEFGNYYVPDLGAEVQIHLEKFTINTDIGYMLGVSKNDNYTNSNLSGLLVGLSLVYWPF